MGQLGSLLLFDWDGGMLPSQVGQLTSLTDFFVQDCINALPSQIGLLSLEALGLDGTGFQAPPTQLASMASLRSLSYRFADTSENFLESVHRSAVHIEIDNNKFSSSIPTSLGLCSGLTNLRLTRNWLTGTVPTQLGQLTELTQLVVSFGDGLHGTLPTQLGALANLTNLALDANTLRGNVPTQFGQCALLRSLVLSDNELSGTVPSQIGLLSALTVLGVASNDLSGTLPSELGALVELVSLELDTNRLGGTLAPELARLTALTHVTIASNQFSGRWPVEGAMLAKWAAHCDHSGLVLDRQCARECPSCGPLGIVIAGCDSRGFDNTCAPWYVLVPALACVLAGMWYLAARSSGKKKLSWTRRGALAAGSTFAALAWVAVLAFVNASTGAIRTLVIAVLGFRVLVTSLVTTAELAHEHLSSPATHILSYSELVRAFLHCVVDPFIVLELSRTSVRLRTVVAVLGTVLSADVPLLVLESVELHRTRNDSEKESVTTLALALTCALVVSCARVFVLHRNVHK